MRTLLILVGMTLSLVSCETINKYLGPTVQDRDADGKRITPKCPKCGLEMSISECFYLDTNGHFAHAP